MFLGKNNWFVKGHNIFSLHNIWHASASWKHRYSEAVSYAVLSKCVYSILKDLFTVAIRVILMFSTISILQHFPFPCKVLLEISTFTIFNTCKKSQLYLECKNRNKMDDSYRKNEEISGWKTYIKEHVEKMRSFNSYWSLCPSENCECWWVHILPQWEWKNIISHVLFHPEIFPLFSYFCVIFTLVLYFHTT